MTNTKAVATRTITREDYIRLGRAGHAGTALTLGDLGALIQWRDARPDWDRRFWAMRPGGGTAMEPVNVR